MILGFGNNVVSSLASDITASQTTITVMPGGGPAFAALLTSDFSNNSTTLKNYAKITLTDSGETVFEVCHLTAVIDDTLTVIRGQEGTAAKGWSLKDIISNFATRGSENGFAQVAHIQSGFYTSGTAGGTANALTLELPTTFFLNGSVDWVLKTPLVVYPAQNNTGPATLQLTMGGKVIGTLPLYKGNKTQLAANDILKDVGLICLLDNTKAFFNVANPGAIYAGLGTAAFHDVTTSKSDTAAGHVLQVGDYGLGVANGTVTCLESIFEIPCSGEYNALGDGATPPTAGLPAGSGNTRFAVYAGNIYSNQYLVTLTSNKYFYVGIVNTSAKTAAWSQFYNTLHKPTAEDTGALPINGTKPMVGRLTLDNSGQISFPEKQYVNKALGNMGTYGTSAMDYRWELYANSVANSALRSNIMTVDVADISKGSTASGGGTNPTTHITLAAALTVSYRVTPGDYGNFDVRYIANIQLGAEASMTASGGSGSSQTAKAPNGNVVTGTKSNYNDSNWEVDTLYYNPLQKQNYGGAWVTING